jgi:hypothetical protein
MEWDDFRSWNNERRVGRVKKFIDGDLIESFLDLSREKQDQVVKLMDDEGGWEGDKEGGVGEEEGEGVERDEHGRVVLSLDLVLAKVEAMSRLHS